MSKVSRSKPEVDERRRTTSNKPQPEERAPAAQERPDQNDDYQQQEPAETSPLPSGRTSELQRTDRKQETSQTERDDEKKLKNFQKKVSRKMALGRLRQAVLQQNVEMITQELDEIEDNYPELEDKESVQDARQLLEVLKVAEELKMHCDEGNVDEIKRVIETIGKSKDKKFQEMLKLQVREAKYVLEGLTKPPVRKAGRLQVDFHSFNELRRYVNPPQGVLPTMQAVFLLLGVDEGRTETWPDIQRLCKPTGSKSLFSRVLNVKVEEIEPEFAARAKEIIHYGKDAGTQQKDTRKTKMEHAETTETSADTPEPETDDAENKEDPEAAEDEGQQHFSASTAREASKEQDSDKKSSDIVRERLRMTCPVAWTLQLWALDMITQVEAIHGQDAEPAGVKRQREILGYRLPRQPRMDRQYYHILAKNSLTRSYQQAYGTSYYGGQSNRNTFPPLARTQYQQHPQQSGRKYDYYPSSPRRLDDDDDVRIKTWRGTGPYRNGYNDRSRDQLDREN